MTFEVAIARLEEIVRMLESGNAPLDESLSIFEEIEVEHSHTVGSQYHEPTALFPYGVVQCFVCL